MFLADLGANVVLDGFGDRVPVALESAELAGNGVGDADGNAIEPGPEAINALLDLWPIFEAFQLSYVAKGLLLEQEKNVSAPLPNGASAGASATARPVSKRAKTARRG